MSKPRERHPGEFYFVTRRCHRRELRLTPSAVLNGAVGALVHDACERTGVEVIAMCWMSNHYHAVVRDPEGRISEWLSHLNGTLARFCNATQGTSSHVWDAQEGKEERLDDVAVVAKRVAYVLANPVAAGLVHAPSAWPGVITRFEELGTGRGRAYRRPSQFFRADGPVSEWGEVASFAPPGVTPERFRAMVKVHLDEALEDARRAVAESGRGYLGVAKILAQNVFDAAVTPEPVSAGLDVKPFRRIAASSPERVLELVAQQQRFQDRYAQALHRLQTQDRAIFPRGTYKVWRFFGARREPPLHMQAA